MNTPIIISATAYSTGYGKMPYKTVNGLSADERAAIRDRSAIVLMVGCPPSGGGNNTGTTVREVYEHNGRFYHRLPTADMLKAAGL